MIECLLKTDHITDYIYGVMCVCFNKINLNFKSTFNVLRGKNNIIVINDLKLFVPVNEINDFIKQINTIHSIYSNIDVNIYPEFYHLKNMLINLRTIFIKLLNVEKKAKALFINLINTDKIEVIDLYGTFLYEIAQEGREKIDLTKYKELNYTILSHIQKLIKIVFHTETIIYYLNHSFICYLIYYSLVTNNALCINFDRPSSVSEQKDKVTELLTSINKKIKIYWSNYIDSTKITIFLQLLIRDIEIMIIANTSENTKLETNIKVLVLLISSYEEDISNKLSMCVDYLRIQQFLLAILEHINNR